jgi:D-arabinose 1-dehydrogenase-like Zn-dependent alcohol dehydrogenase
MTDIRYLWNKQMNFLGSHLGTKGELMQALRWVESGHIKPLVSKVLPLREIAQAQLAMENDEVVGKIVLKPDS